MAATQLNSELRLYCFKGSSLGNHPIKKSKLAYRLVQKKAF
jgi:hypothetical protein